MAKDTFTNWAEPTVRFPDKIARENRREKKWNSKKFNKPTRGGKR